METNQIPLPEVAAGPGDPGFLAAPCYSEYKLPSGVSAGRWPPNRPGHDCEAYAAGSPGFGFLYGPPFY